MRTRQVLAMLTATATFAALAAVVGTGVPPLAGAAANAAVEPTGPPPPADLDPGTPGIQVQIPFFSEPEFLLQAGDETWSLRNRPAGTVAAAYGHTDDAVHSELMSTARVGKLPTGSQHTYGSVAAGRAPLDAAYLGHSDHRGHDWQVTRYDDNSITVTGAMEEALGQRRSWTFGPGADPADASGYVGGWVISDAAFPDPDPDAAGHILSIALVKPEGTVRRFRMDSTGAWVSDSLNIPGLAAPASAAVARTYTSYGPVERLGVGGDYTNDAHLSDTSPHDRTPDTETIVVVLGADGMVHLVRPKGLTAGGDIVWDEWNDGKTYPNFRAIAGTTPLLDADWSCVEGMEDASPNTLIGQGVVGQVLGCGRRAGDPGVTPYTVGRLAVAVGRTSADAQNPDPSKVAVITFTDFIAPLFNPVNAFYGVGTETISEVACDFPGDLWPGAFDLRVVLGVTHVVCAPTGANYVESYQQPKSNRIFNGKPVQVLGNIVYPEDPTWASETASVQMAPLSRTWVDPMHEPDGSGPDSKLPIHRTTYVGAYRPSIQLQFPCASLLDRPARNGYAVPDCDQQTNQGLPTGKFLGAAPINWASFTLAWYSSTQAGGDRLFVATGPLSTPTLARIKNGAEVFGPGYQRANFASIVEPSPYLADDLTALREDPTVDVSSFQKYAVPANPPPLLLSQVPRSERTQLTLTIDNPQPTLEHLPSVPVAVLQAPPLVEGLGQQEDFTPTFAARSSSGSSTSQGKSTRLGSHIGFEMTATIGSGAAGSHIRAGGGGSVSFDFMNEVEESIDREVEVSTTEAYGGSFSDSTVVTRTISEWVWPGTVTHDPTGLTTGQALDYRVPDQEVTQSIPLSTLETSYPGLYGENGLFRESLDRILRGSTPGARLQVGNPGSYLAGASTATPASILDKNGGPCRGDFTDPAAKTTFDGLLPDVVSPTNPYYSQQPDDPIGPNVITSAKHVVSVGNDLTEGAIIGLTSSTSESKLATKSFDFSGSAIIKAEAELDLGVSAEVEATLEFGPDAGWGESSGVSETLAQGSELSTTIGNIALTSDDVGLWVDDEDYSWRMFMCKSQLGPVGLGSEVWVQGYVVDNYLGGGGLTDITPATDLSPAQSAVVVADPTRTPVALTGCPTAPPADSNRLGWVQEAGTLSSYEVQVENVTGGGALTPLGQSWATPRDFNDHVKRHPDDDRALIAPRPSCADLDTGAFVDGDLYRWRVIANGFITSELSDWEFMRAQVWPPATTSELRIPLVNADGSVTLDIVDQAEVTSLKHHVVVSNADSGAVVAQATAAGSSYRTPTLPDGRYKATVVGYNGHKLDTGARAETPADEVTFTVSRALTAQYSIVGCASTPCSTKDILTFVDRSRVSVGAVTSWAWDFGDGATSSVQQPTHQYAAAGTYPVELTVTDSNGQTASVSQDIEVKVPDPDTDDDGVPDPVDNCPLAGNPGQNDTDGDGIGNACDITPNGDNDGDLVDNNIDNCPDAANASQADLDGDGIGDVCDSAPGLDADGDKVEDGGDNCLGVANPAQTDSDGDGKGNACDSTPNGDTDNDGIDNHADNCPSIANPGQVDNDGDGHGNACDSTPNGDTDTDGVDNLSDNCPAVANPLQTDTDGDGKGNACDSTPNGDTDTDSVDNLTDNCPGVANPAQTDTDGDGLGDACDATPGTIGGLKLSFKVTDAPDVREAAGAMAVFTVRLSAPADRVVAVSFGTVDKAALAGLDYVSAAGVLAFQPGEQVKQIKVGILTDSVKEKAEAFQLKLFAPTNRATVATSLANAKILDAT